MAGEADDRIARLPRAFVPDLTVAVRRARLEEVERAQTADELRSGEIARLESLRAALAPLFAQTGLHAGLFDHGLVAGDRPRLFIDIIAFVDCGHDRKRYRFVQDRRDGPMILAEDERIEPIVDAVTLYVARRIVEREKALAALAHAEKRAAPPPPGDVPEPGRGNFFGLLTLFAAGAAAGAAAHYAMQIFGRTP